jgi:hypothetical protein
MTMRCHDVAMLSLSAFLALAAPAGARPVGGPSSPTPPNAAVSTGLSLEHECLNAVRATRHSPTMTRSVDGEGSAKQAVASAHLDRAEEAARAGHGQACQDEVGLAANTLNALADPPIP